MRTSKQAEAAAAHPMSCRRRGPPFPRAGPTRRVDATRARAVQGSIMPMKGTKGSARGLHATGPRPRRNAWAQLAD